MEDPPTQILIDTSLPTDDPGHIQEVPLAPEEIADRERLAAEHEKRQRRDTHAVAEGGERLTLIHERAGSDPAYAALARELGVI